MSVYSPTSKPSQEFLAFKVSSVPEAGVTLLMLLGFAGIGISGVFRPRGKKSV